MSKLKTIVITGIATLGTIGAGLTAVALIPSVKKSVSVSVNDKVVYGSEQNAENEKLKTELNSEKEKVAELTATKSKNEKTIKDLTASNSELQTQVDSLTTEVNQKQETVANLENEISVKNTEIQAKQETVNSLNSQIEANNARIAELEEQGISDSEEIANLTSTNNSLNSQISNLNNEISTLNTDKETLNNQISTLNSDIQVKETEINNLNSIISTHETQILELNNQLTSLNSQLAEKDNRITELEEQLANSSGNIGSLGLIEVNYKENDTANQIVYQKQNSVVDFSIKPAEDGKVFVGWSKDGTNEIITNVDASSTLVANFVNNDIVLSKFNSVKTFENYSIKNFVFGSTIDLAHNSRNESITLELIGLTNDSTSIVPITEFEENTEYYAIYYVPEMNTIVAFDSVSELMLQFEYGVNCYDIINVNYLLGTETQEIYKHYENSSNYAVHYNSVTYNVIGLSSAIDSTDIVNSEDLLPHITYYPVYEDSSTGEIYSLKSLREHTNIVMVHSLTLNGEKSEFVDISTLSSYGATLTLDGVTIQKGGFTDSSEKTTSISVTQENLLENNIVHLYQYYRIRNNEDYSYTSISYADLLDAISEPKASQINYRTSVTATSSTTKNNVHLLSAFEKDITQDGVTFTFVGWSLSADSTEVTTEFTAEDTIYAVYKRSDTEELLNTTQFNFKVVANKLYWGNDTGSGNSYASNVVFTSKYEEDFVAGDKTYKFIGWSTSNSTLTLVDLTDGTTHSYLYSIYQDTETGYYYNDDISSTESIYYVNESGTYTTISSRTPTSYQADFVLNDATYKFVGWSTSSSSASVVDFTTHIIGSSSFGYYAVYQEETSGYLYTTYAFRNTLTASYVLDGSATTTTTKNLYSLESNVTINDIEYTFVGWVKTSTATSVLDLTKTGITNTTYYAVYQDTDGNLMNSGSLS